MKKLVFVGIGVALLAGCVPGEAEFTLRTSEVRKALGGEVARIQVHETAATVLSNASRRVSFGGGKFTNQLDVVKAMVKELGSDTAIEHGYGAWSSDTEAVRVWVEEKAGALPCVKLEATIDVALGTKTALAKQVSEGKPNELGILQIDPQTGQIGDVDETELGKEFARQRSASFRGARFARCELIKTLFGKEGSDLAAVDASLTWVALPTWFRNLSCVVVGDGDEPLYVVAEDAKVDGKPMARFEGWVKKGEKVRFELDKRKHDKHGGMRFFLEKPVAPAS